MVSFATDFISDETERKKFGDSLGWNKGDVFTGKDREVNRINRLRTKNNSHSGWNDSNSRLLVRIICNKLVFSPNKWGYCNLTLSSNCFKTVHNMPVKM